MSLSRNRVLAAARRIGLLIFAAGFATRLAGSVSVPPLGHKVVAYCEAHLGKQVGSGECAALAYQALKAAGAKTRGGPDYPNHGDYVWGREVCMIEATPDGPRLTTELTAIQAGDVMQYRNVKFVKSSAHHHTVVIKTIDPATGMVHAFAQNSAGRRYVVEVDIPLLKLSRGWIRIYRPIHAGH